MKKLFTLIAATMIFMGGYAQGTYTVSKDETFTAGEEINSVENIKMILGGSGAFTSGKKRANYVDEDFQCYTQAINGIYNENAEPGGGYFIFKTAKKGALTIGVDVNKGKRLVLQDAKFNVISDFTYNLPSTAGGESQVLDATKGISANSYGTITLDVEAGGTYYLVLSGSKLGVQGFKYFVDASSPETLTTAASGFATYASSQVIDYAKSGLTAYAVTYDASAGKLLYNKLEGAVKANTGVVVCGESAKAYTLAVSTDEAVDVTSELQISDGSVVGDGATIYALSTKNGETGFYRVKDGLAVPAGKGYLKILQVSAAKEFFAIGNETTGISSIEAAAPRHDNVAYSLSGQRVGDSYKGIVIINGKKVIRK